MTSEQFLKQHAEIFKEYHKLKTEEYAAYVQSFVGKYYAIGDFWGYKKFIHIIRPKNTVCFFAIQVSQYEICPIEIKVDSLKEYSEITKEEFMQQIELLKKRIADYEATETYSF